MAETDHASLVKCSGNKVVEGEDSSSSRTAKCLRGRLLAERLASRNAREEAEKLGIKVLEVENLLKQEAKSRKRAEKKLQFLMRRLECMNISYAAADESEHSSVSCSEMGSNENTNINSSPSTFDQFEASDFMSCEDEHEPQQPQSPADEELGVNNSMALVPVTVSMPPAEDERIEPEVLDATVKQVLESLRRAKEQLQSSMERRRRRMNINMIQVG